MRMINCSRSGIEPLKFWWLMKTVGDEGWTEQAARIFENTRYLKSELKRIGWPYWNNEYSNTVIFRRPSAKVVRKYNLLAARTRRLAESCRMLSSCSMSQRIRSTGSSPICGTRQSRICDVNRIPAHLGRLSRRNPLAGHRTA